MRSLRASLDENIERGTVTIVAEVERASDAALHGVCRFDADGQTVATVQAEIETFPG
jgi:hypothetical protein